MNTSALTRRRAMQGTALAAATAMASFGSSPGNAQGAAWPSRPVRIVVPFPAGGTTDLLARILAEPLQQRLGAPFVVENRGGAGGSVGSDLVSKADPDGYTLLMTTIGTAAINYELYKGSDPVWKSGFQAHVRTASASSAVTVSVLPSTCSTLPSALRVPSSFTAPL